MESKTPHPSPDSPYTFYFVHPIHRFHIGSPHKCSTARTVNCNDARPGSSCLRFTLQIASIKPDQRKICLARHTLSRTYSSSDCKYNKFLDWSFIGHGYACRKASATVSPPSFVPSYDLRKRHSYVRGGHGARVRVRTRCVRESHCVLCVCETRPRGSPGGFFRVILSLQVGYPRENFRFQDKFVWGHGLRYY